MEPNNVFVGMGANPEPNVPDIPLGLGMALSQNVDAMSYFGTLTSEQKTGVIRYVQGAGTGEDAKARINSAAENLKQHKIDFI